LIASKHFSGSSDVNLSSALAITQRRTRIDGPMGGVERNFLDVFGVSLVGWFVESSLARSVVGRRSEKIGTLDMHGFVRQACWNSAWFALQKDRLTLLWLILQIQLDGSIPHQIGVDVAANDLFIMVEFLLAESASRISVHGRHSPL
jgi:hypothetical protein